MILGRGTVSWFNESKGYGFILPEEEQYGQIFVHHSVLFFEDPADFRLLHEGQTVDFEACNSAKGYQATRVTIVPEE